MDEKEVTNVTQEEIAEFYSENPDFEKLDDLRHQCLDDYINFWLCSQNTRDEEGFLNYLKQDSDDVYRYLSECWPGSSLAAIINSSDFKKYFHEYYEKLIGLFRNFDSLEDERITVLHDHISYAIDGDELIQDEYTVEGLVLMIIDRVNQMSVGDFELPRYNPFINDDCDGYDFMYNYLTTWITDYLEP